MELKTIFQFKSWKRIKWNQKNLDWRLGALKELKQFENSNCALLRFLRIKKNVMTNWLSVQN